MLDDIDGVKPLTIGAMPKDEALAHLEPLGADVVKAYSADPPWKHTSHAFGFVAQSSGSGPVPIIPVGSIPPNPGLRNKRLNVTLNRLRVADYPGDGVHLVLFDFSARNQTTNGSEQVNFNVKVRASEQGGAALIGLPIFVGLGVGSTGLTINCRTVNVANDEDEKMLSFLDSETFKSGLSLIETAQPAMVPFSQMVVGMTKSIAGRRRNVLVQEFRMGLDFGGPVGGARLSEGDYIVVQVPASKVHSWDWSSWHFDRDRGQIVNVSDADAGIPYNYLMFGVTRH